MMHFSRKWILIRMTVLSAQLRRPYRRRIAAIAPALLIATIIMDTSIQSILYECVYLSLWHQYLSTKLWLVAKIGFFYLMQCYG